MKRNHTFMLPNLDNPKLCKTKGANRETPENKHTQFRDEFRIDQCVPAKNDLLSCFSGGVFAELFSDKIRRGCGRDIERKLARARLPNNTQCLLGVRARAPTEVVDKHDRQHAIKRRFAPNCPDWKMLRCSSRDALKVASSQAAHVPFCGVVRHTSRRPFRCAAEQIMGCS